MDQEQEKSDGARINVILDMVLPSYIEAIPPEVNDAHQIGLRTVEIKRLKDEAGDKLLEELKLSAINPLHPEMSELATKLLNQRFDKYL